MTTTTSINISERSAVAAAATLDTTRPDYAHAVNIAMARRGSRDAFIVHIARRGAWKELIDALGTVAPTSPDAAANIDATVAAAHWALGDTRTATTIASRHRGHRMSDLIVRLADSDVDPAMWTAVMAGLTDDECFAFEN